MKNAARDLIIGAGCALSALPGSAAFAQSGIKSQAEITKDLTTPPEEAVPRALREGQSGLPMPGAAPAARPRQSVMRASVSGAGVASETPARPSAPVSIAAVQGCPTAAEAAKTSLPSITFEFGSAQLRPEAMVQLQNLGKSLKEDLSETSTFVIEGHTDATGAYDYNRELSMQRAQAVKDYLAQQMGVKQPLEITGVGYCDLANPGDPRAAENRRVVVINKAS